MNVQILLTCRDAELLPAATLVFKTLRVGFPTANVTVTLNFQDGHALNYNSVAAAARSSIQDAGLTAIRIDQTIHHEWIKELLERESHPFFLCDTDMVFFDSFEKWTFPEDCAMAGRYVPQFKDKFTNCITRPRLHTSLLYMNPVEIRKRVEKYFGQFPKTPFNPMPNLIYPCQFPMREGRIVRNLFHDTCCLLYQAIAGQHFTEPMLDCYAHLNFGTISDLIAPHYPEERWRESHFAIFENPELARGAWKAQQAFYEKHAC